MALAQGFDDQFSGGFRPLLAQLADRHLQQHRHHPAPASVTARGVDQCLQLLPGVPQLALMQIPLAGGATGDDLHFMGSPRALRVMAPGKLLDTLQRSIRLLFIAPLLGPAHAQHQCRCQQAVQVVAAGKLLQTLDPTPGLGVPARQPVGHGQGLHGLQHTVGNRHPLQQLHARLQQLARGLVVALFIQRHAQQRGCHAADDQIGHALAFCLFEHLAVQVLGFGAAPFKRQAHAREAAPHQAAPW
ncbi:hypothetical protein D3C77_236760 [compost metagenome]